MIRYSMQTGGLQISEVTHAPTKYQRDIIRCEFRHDLEGYLASSNAQRKTLQEIVNYYEQYPYIMMKYGNAYLRYALDTASGKLDDIAYVEALSERNRLRTQMLESLRGYDA